ncbi:MAG: glycosyltransferase [Actinobacteria bacterium]|nr:glycosyltransferase [Actinomycetota bacterium]
MRKEGVTVKKEYGTGGAPGRANRKGVRLLSGVSFITTVYNEEDSIIEFLQSLKDQTCLPEEMIIVDGGSGDRTFELAADFFKDWAAVRGGKVMVILETGEDAGGSPEGPSGSLTGKAGPAGQDILTVRLLKEKGAGISRGRNTAIANSKGKYICVSDAGCRIDPNWLEEISRFPEEESGDKGSTVIGGMDYADCGSFLQKCQALCIMPGLDETRVESFMPSSRNICFKRKDWEKVGGYPEDLDYGEDMRFDFNLKKTGCRLRFNPEAIVYWKMREDLGQIFRQFFRYARGDALGRMYPVRHLIRFLTGLGFLVIIFIAVFFSPYILLSFLLLFAAYSYKPYRRMFCKWQGNERCRPATAAKIPALFFIPFLLIYIDTAKVYGYLYGLIKR